MESFDRHYAVNVRASWLLVKEYAERFPRRRTGPGRIVALTSDHVVRQPAVRRDQGRAGPAGHRRRPRAGAPRLTANVVNPGPVDTGWMSDELRERILAQTPLGRGGTPAGHRRPGVVPAAPSDGGWVNGQLLCSRRRPARL